MFERIKESVAYRLRNMHHKYFPLYDVKNEPLQRLLLESEFETMKNNHCH